MKLFKTLISFLFLALTACVSTQSINFDIDYTSSNTIFYFDKKGDLISKNLEEYLSSFTPPIISSEIISRLNDDGKFELFNTKTNEIILSSEIGEKINVVGFDSENIYFLTDINSEYLRLEKYNLKSKEFEIVDERNCDINNLLLFNKKNQTHLAIVSYTDGHKNYYDNNFRIAELKILQKYNPLRISWQEKSPICDKWIISLSFKNRPQKMITFDFNTMQIDELADSFANWQVITDRKEIEILSRDDVKINAILTFPVNIKNKKNLPLIVFPHGGPTICSTLDFDFRAYYLAREGFLVLQPNYRGSSLFGKTFRFAGYKAKGIKKAQQDIEDCVKFLIESNGADKNKIAILGGSWGAYCSAYALTFTPQYYKAGILFFGAYNLPEMLKTSPANSGANKGLDELQYGVIPTDEKALNSISPINFVKNIRASLWVYHFKQDDVIEYSQSEALVKKLREFGKNVEFISGDGLHGFKSDEIEEQIYTKITKNLKRIIK